MARILQHDENLLLQATSDTSSSSNPIYVGGRFTVAIADSLSAKILDATTAVYLMVNNSNPVNAKGGDYGPPDAGYSGTYSENTNFAARWVPFFDIRTSTASDASTVIAYDKPVRYIALSADANASLKQCFSGSLSGFVFSDYSACKTH